MKNIALQKLSSLDHLIFPDEYHDLSMSSPAESVMVNFNRERPHVIDSNLSAIEANRLMMKTHSNVALIANKAGEFIGLVSSRILTERSIIRLVANGMAREDINVTEVMLPRDSIQAIDFEKVRRSKVAEIVSVLQECGEEYCLVVDSCSHLICGMFGISDIARRLHTPILLRRKQSFAELVTAMTH